MCVAFGVCVPALTPAVALADQNTIDVGASPIVRITLGSGTVNVRTWDRQAVRIDDTTDLDVKKSEVESSEAQSAIPVFAGRLPGASGVLELPTESFVVSTIPPGPRPLVSIRGHDTDVTVTVPRTAALVTVQLNKGNVSIQDYRSGTFVARVRFGNVRLDDVGDARGLIALSGSRHGYVEEALLRGDHAGARRDGYSGWNFRAVPPVLATMYAPALLAYAIQRPSGE